MQLPDADATPLTIVQTSFDAFGAPNAPTATGVADTSVPAALLIGGYDQVRDLETGGRGRHDT